MYANRYMARLPQLAATNEVLVPIRLDFEIDNLKLRDTFTWNLHGIFIHCFDCLSLAMQNKLNNAVEQLMTPDMFAEYLCLDLGFPQHMQSAISSSIQSQLSEYRTFLVSSDAPPSIDSRVPIILDLHVGKIYLRDRFEWDLSSTMTPEHFALILTQDLGLGSEFPALISHSIREQVFKLRSDGDVVFNPFALEARIRGEEEAQGWCPTVELMTLEELEKFDMGRERKSRYVPVHTFFWCFCMTHLPHNFRAQRREQKLANRRKSGWSAADTVTNGPITSATTTNATTRVVSGSVHDEAMSSGEPFLLITSRKHLTHSIHNNQTMQNGSVNTAVVHAQKRQLSCRVSLDPLTLFVRLVERIWTFTLNSLIIEKICSGTFQERERLHVLAL